MARRDNSDPSGLGKTLNWAFSWPANRRILYNRASCDPSGKPWDPKRKLICWNGTAWVGVDVPDFKPDSAPGDGMSPFIMNPEGVARLFAVDKMAEGPFPEHYEPFETPIDTNPLHPKVISNPAARVFKDDLEAFGKSKEFPYAATTYRLTEHFHFWTKHTKLSSILQPEQFVEIGEELAKEKGIKDGDRVKVRSNRGFIKAVAVVTKRIEAAQGERQEGPSRGHPDPLGFQGHCQDRLPGQHPDPFRGRCQYADAGVQVLPRQHREGIGGGPWHCNRLTSSAVRPRPPRRRNQRQTPEVAKLIDVSNCIGCKACQVACMEWNDIRDAIGTNHGVYDNPTDLTENSWTVMRYTEVETDRGLEWLIRKDGCMHCADPGCLKACPAPGAIVQYSNGIVDFHEENCIGCGYCITGCPFNIPRLSNKDSKVYKCTLCSDRVAVGLEPACVKTCPTGRSCSAPRRRCCITPRNGSPT